MRLPTKTLFLAPILALAVMPARDAAACGGCFHETGMQQTESTQVTGHRMILSVSKTQSTLWDQISYSGNPSSFAWVLPVKGMIDIGVSSDALFGNLELMTKVTVNSPVVTCPGPPSCGNPFSASSSANSAAASSSSSGGGVTVIAQKVVGPYETAQLSSQDPQALKTWLTMHNYAIPAEIDPIIAAYVADGFDFLALKLVPGLGIQAMKPVRVTLQGASPVLPLRMVSAGTGATTSITLWVIGEGIYVPSNFPSFTIDQSQLVWWWAAAQSNYKALRQAGYTATQGRGWLVEAGEPMSQFSLSASLTDLAMFYPLNSGYGDDMGIGAPAACAADLAALFSGINEPSTTISRVHAELPRAALDSDLSLMAAPDQTPVQRNFFVTQSIGPPPCPLYPPCGGDGFGGAGGDGSFVLSGGGCAGDCAIGSGAGAPLPVGLSALALCAVTALRRKRRFTAG